MSRLMLVLMLIVGATFAGSAVVTALVLGLDGVLWIAGAAAAGVLAAIPASWLIARRLEQG